MLRLQTWEDALCHNKDMYHRDIIAIENHNAFHKATANGDLFDIETCELFPVFFDFVLDQQILRRTSGRIPQGWLNFCIQRQFDLAYIGPRWTLPFCYFGELYSKCFNGTIGLDVGCNIASESLKKMSDKFIAQAKKSQDYIWEFETFSPHYSYYQELGCNIKGIDINPLPANPAVVSHGDLRMLVADDAIIDFFTIPMIIGPGNPACTYLDVALCLGELRRTCNRNGLIYIADFIVMPSLVRCVIAAGFRVFANNSYQDKVPIGIFLIREDANINNSSFQPVMEYLLKYELIIPYHDGCQTRIINRELLRKLSPPPKVELIFSDDGHN